MNPFDLTNTPLFPGVALIEASAGTGKTFSLAGIILRLVLEEHIALKEILAVTYTIAATAELKERVRRRLYEAAEDLRRGSSADPIVARVLEKEDRQRSLHELDLALASFDEAQVFTIHSFCQRVLQDHAFETGAAFDAKLVTDTAPLFQQVATDFWRRTLDGARPLLPVLLLAWEKSPDLWLDLLERTRNHPDLVILPPSSTESIGALTAKADEALDALRAEWKANRSRVETILLSDPNLQRRKEVYRVDNAAKLLKQIGEACGELDCAAPACFKALAEVTAEILAERTLAGKVTPQHRFFDLCSAFLGAVDELFSELTHYFLRYADAELPKRKAVTNTVTFDDLILRVRNALFSDAGPAVIAAVGGKYKAALIDEFQDTDPAQYDIFRTIFGGPAGRHHLFYIGDPKQSIYGFRGADIFTYVAAASDSNRQFTLGTNWRSEAGLVSAVNHLFTQRDHPFVLRAIAYQEVLPGADLQLQLISQTPRWLETPLTFRFLESTLEGGKPINKGASTEAVCESVADDIIRLARSGARVGKRPVIFADMTVLVRTHKEAAEIQAVLRGRGVSSIVQSDQTVFASTEAEQLQQLLSGVLTPQREPLFKAALLTEFIGLTGDDLIELETNEVIRQSWLDRFAQWRKRWTDECFVAMFRELIADQGVREKLARFPDGERRLTDLLHLGELLHGAETAERLSPDGLSEWLRRQRGSGNVAREEFQLRLESDANAVQIVTIHKCKGLEYNFVYCPFLWTTGYRDETLQYHDRANEDRLTIDLRGTKVGDAKQINWQEEEKTSEEARMLYVAVTRAKHRCTIHVPPYKDLALSTLALLFEEGGRSNLRSIIEKLAKNSSGCIQVLTGADKPQQPTPPAPELSSSYAARPFDGRIDRTAMTASFSGLNSGRIETVERAPEISDPAEERTVSSATTGDTIFDFARGARAGDFFHAVLEQLDFAAPEFQPLIDNQLKWHGFAATKCRDALVETFQQLLRVQLPGAGLSLRQITPAKRLVELEFTFRLNRLDPSILHDLFARAAVMPPDFDAGLGRLRFDPVEGYLRGFIDLFFEHEGRYYIADWKSNWLGSQSDDYSREEMAAAMLHHNYYLQADLYALAADLFLQQQVSGYEYEKNFGGVFYVFLRGVNETDPTRGIFHRRPSKETMRVLRELAA